MVVRSFMYRNYLAAMWGNRYPAPLLLTIQLVMVLSGSDQTRSPKDPASGIYCTRFMVAMVSTRGTLGERPPCTHMILSIFTIGVPWITAARGKYWNTSTI